MAFTALPIMQNINGFTRQAGMLTYPREATANRSVSRRICPLCLGWMAELTLDQGVFARLGYPVDRDARVWACSVFPSDAAAFLCQPCGVRFVSLESRLSPVGREAEASDMTPPVSDGE